MLFVIITIHCRHWILAIAVITVSHTPPHVGYITLVIGCHYAAASHTLLLLLLCHITASGWLALRCQWLRHLAE